MTSTNIQVGLSDETASRRAVANVRGRAHTDIFGIAEQDAQQSKSVQPPSNTKSVLMEENIEMKKEAMEIKDNGEKPLKENKTENVQASTFQRVRMPPGGFSSNLW